MKKSFNLIIFLAFVLLLGQTNNTNAQSRVISVEQGIGTLNDVIDGDTTATGERVDPDNTVYELQKGGYYLTNGIISNKGWTLRIRAAEGDGARPVIQPAVIEGGESTYPFRPKGDFYLSGVYLTNMDQDGKLLDRPIRASADSMRIVIDGCHIDYAAQAAFRIDNEWNKIYITNSIISNMGRMSSPANGRGIDDRGNDIDTLVMDNNTFYNLTMTVIRDGGGIINYCKVNQNTIVNVGQFGIHFGETINAQFTNNIMANYGFLGSTGDTRSAFRISAIGEDLVNEGVQQSVVVDNNNFYVAPELIAAHPDTVGVVALFDSTTTALMEQNSTGANNIVEVLDFTTGPNLPTDVIASYYDNTIDLENKTDMDDGGGGPRAGQGVPVQSPFDFAYSTSAASYSAGTVAQPLGDLFWFPGVTEVENSESIPVAFKLFDNYPNPFNPTTTIKYSIPEKADVQLTVFNMLGQEVTTLVKTTQNAGTYSVKWNGKNNFGSQLASGIYLYHLKAGNFVVTRKMVMLK
jgi:hypothetical protein